MPNWARKLETITNIAILLVCLLIAATLLRNWVRPQRPLSAGRTAQIGTAIRLSGIDWKATPQTIVLAISTECRFCVESLPFYRRLTTTAAQHKTSVVAVLPQALAESRAYLDVHQLPIKEIRQLPLELIGVRGTPTVLLVDSEGNVTGVWVGKLSPESEDELLSKL